MNARGITQEGNDPGLVQSCPAKDSVGKFVAQDIGIVFEVLVDLFICPTALGLQSTWQIPVIKS